MAGYRKPKPTANEVTNAMGLIPPRAVVGVIPHLVLNWVLSDNYAYANTRRFITEELKVSDAQIAVHYLTGKEEATRFQRLVNSASSVVFVANPETGALTLDQFNRLNNFVGRVPVWIYYPKEDYNPSNFVKVSNDNGVMYWDIKHGNYTQYAKMVTL